MKATAFAPGHISGFFEPIYHKGDVAKTGSRGAGLCVSFGAISEVTAKGSTNQNIEIYSCYTTCIKIFTQSKSNSFSS